MLEFTELENGKLRITCKKGYKRELRQYHKQHGEINTFLEYTEHYWANGWGVFPDADVLYQMTNAPVISKDATSEDDGSNTLNGPAWWYPNYMITDFIQEILDHGFVDFEFWENMNNANFKNPYMEHENTINRSYLTDKGVKINSV